MLGRVSRLPFTFEIQCERVKMVYMYVNIPGIDAHDTASPAIDPQDIDVRAGRGEPKGLREAFLKRLAQGEGVHRGRGAQEEVVRAGGHRVLMKTNMFSCNGNRIWESNGLFVGVALVCS